MTDVREEVLVTPEVLECPYPYYARVRDEAPVHQTPLGFYVVSRYEDVVAIVRDTERFSSDMRNSFVSGPPSDEVKAIQAEGYPSVNTLLTNDPPSHTQFRGLVNKAFTPKRVAQLEGEIRQIAGELMDRWVDAGRVELVTQFAVGLPLTVIADALGVSRDDMADFKRWSDDAVAPLSGMLPPDRQVECARSRVEMQRYMAERVRERASAPRDDLLSDLVQARFDQGDRVGQGLDLPELLNVIEQLLVAGNETTTKLISAGMQLLLDHPEQMVAVAADHSLVPNLVEEALRVESPVQMLPRVAKVDVEVGGIAIPAGSILMMMYGCANRDEAKFSDGEAFDVRRTNARAHLAFGNGAHFCPGAALARSEGRIAFETLLDRATDWALDTTVESPTHRELSMTLRGLSALHLTFRPDTRPKGATA
ncbi:MAG: cytochrome P450 [Ilumatobacteraceae bacterium]